MSIKGFESFFEILEVVKDPARYEAKVKELQKEYKQYREVVEAVVSLAGVNDYTLSIKNKEARIKVALEEATSKAAFIVDKAKKEAAEVKAQAEADQHELTAKENAVSLKEQAVLASKLDLDRLVTANQELQTKLAEKQKELQVLEADLKDKQKKLLAALK